MKTTELIELLQSVEFGASGRSREITIRSIYKNGNTGRKKILSESDILEIRMTGDGCCGAELMLGIVKPELKNE